MPDVGLVLLGLEPSPTPPIILPPSLNPYAGTPNSVFPHYESPHPRLFDPFFSRHFSPCGNSLGCRDNVIHLFTMSKSFGLAGWRVGYAVYPSWASKEMVKVQDTLPTHACTGSQKIALAALEGVCQFGSVSTFSRLLPLSHAGMSCLPCPVDCAVRFLFIRGGWCAPDDGGECFSGVCFDRDRGRKLEEDILTLQRW